MEPGVTEEAKQVKAGNSDIKVLIIDDEKSFTEELHEYLGNSGFQAIEANTADEGLAVLKKKQIDLLILDVRLPGISGLEILKLVKVKYPEMEVIIVSAHGDMDTVISAMRLGTIDYLRKPFRHLDIQIAIERTQKFLFLQQRIKKVEEQKSLISRSLKERIERNFIGASQKILQVLDMAMTAAKFSETNVLITGESGTGKENIARIIHFASDRKNNFFGAVNSSAINESLLESEFFGHKKGSFTGAINDKKGFFEICDEGTLFLDEIADMPLNLQAKILRAIEEKAVTPVGDTKKISANFRIISATNRDVEKLVEENKFRLDLLHRMNTLHIHIPPLRERTEDIEPLLKYFIEDFSIRFNRIQPSLSNRVVKMLKNYEFPGNVRELKNMTERALILCKGDYLDLDDFPLKQKQRSAQNNDQPKLNLIDSEIELIRISLQNSGYNQKAAAEKLGISRDALIRKMKKYKIIVSRKEA